MILGKYSFVPILEFYKYSWLHPVNKTETSVNLHN